MTNPLTMKSWSPYVVGAGIGMLSWFAFASADHPLGVTTAFEDSAALTARTAVPTIEHSNEYFAKKAAEGKPPKIGWEWMLVVGGFVDLVKLDIKPTRYAANIIGGLLFGVGFGLLGYCPGTGAAALGQGNWDVLSGIVGLMLGSYLFAELSGVFSKTVNKWGDRGKLTLPELVYVNRTPFLLIWVPFLIAVLFAIDRFAAR